MNVIPGQIAAPLRQFQLVGGELCLDFCITVGGHRSGRSREYLNSCGDFLGWCEQAGLVDRTLAITTWQKSAQQPKNSSKVLRRAVQLRESIYRIFIAVMQDKKPPEKDLLELNGELGRSLNRLEVTAKKDGFEWGWRESGSSLEAPLGPIARSAAQLLTCPHSLDHVRQCRGDNCGWLFIDSSKNHSRCWCDMRDCGNREKVRRHRLKKSDVRRLKSEEG